MILPTIQAASRGRSLRPRRLGGSLSRARGLAVRGRYEARGKLLLDDFEHPLPQGIVVRHQLDAQFGQEASIDPFSPDTCVDQRLTQSFFRLFDSSPYVTVALPEQSGRSLDGPGFLYSLEDFTDPKAKNVQVELYIYFCDDALVAPIPVRLAVKTGVDAPEA